MKLQLVLSATALAITAFVGNAVFAQMTMAPGKMGMATAPSMTDGEVRKIDKEVGKITMVDVHEHDDAVVHHHPHQDQYADHGHERERPDDGD